MRIAVFGTGAVGGYFGGRLAQSGEDVVFIARRDHLKAMLTHGLRVDSINGDFVVQPVQATDNPKKVGTVDVVLLGVKAWQVREAAQAIRPLIGPHTAVVPLQNGVEAPTHLSEALGTEHVLGGLCGLISFVAGPGHIRHSGAEPFVRFGELDNHPSARAKALHQAFVRAGVTAEIPADIQVALWMKFLFITPWSGIGAVTRAPVGVWRSLAETREIVSQCLHEIMVVAHGHSIDLPPDAKDKTWAIYERLPPEGTSSLQRDIMAGRPSEYDAQIGAVVRFGKAVGVETPVHGIIQGSLLPQELRARGRVEFDA